MTKAVNPEGGVLNVEYDWIGRRIAMESKDIGRKEYDYDSRGNLSRESDSVLRGKGTFIRYVYDGLNRLTLIDYPESTDTAYEYGAPGAPNGQANRIAKVTDETGSTRYAYGKLGETTEETRTINHIISGQGVNRTKTTAYTSNYLGQLETILFDDNEKVRYEYNAGGQIRSVTGYKEIQIGNEEDGIFRYVKDIGYDEYGQRVFIEYGNGVKTTYTYDPHRRWLTNIVTKDAKGITLQNIDYGINRVGNVDYYVNNSDLYYTKQNYTYDNLYQLTGVKGETKNYLTNTKQITTLDSTYTQTFAFDNLGNGKMTSKTSTEKSMGTRNGDSLNYTLQYRYYEGTHKAEQIGDMYYKYDSNGNLLTERFGGHATTSAVNAQVREENGIYSTDYGFALTHPDSTVTSSGIYQRDYRWNERNLLSRSVDSQYRVEYRYGADGQRAIKYSFHAALEGETLYFNRFFQTDYSSSRNGWQESKHIFVGETRIATKRREERTGTNYGQEKKETYFYHGDHLGSAQMVTGNTGEVYEQLEYTPYGELWVEHLSGTEATPFRFTAKERDSQTGLYYFGARYLDPHTSRWLSADPAMGEYIPQAPINDEAKKHNQNLPGMGGVYNYVNFHAYHYAGNNPVKLVDPDGKWNLDGDTVVCDLKDETDMQTAMNFVQNDHSSGGTGKYNKIVASDGSKLSITFDNWQDLNDYLSAGISYDQLAKAIDFIGTEAGLGSMAFEEIAPQLSKSLGLISTGLSIRTLLIDFEKARKDPNWDTISDVVIDGIGFIPDKRAAILSLGLTYTKQGVKGVMKAGEGVYYFNKNFSSNYMEYANKATKGWGW